MPRLRKTNLPLTKNHRNTLSDVDSPYISIRNPFCAGDEGEDAKRSDRDCEAIFIGCPFGGLLASGLRIGIGLATPYGQKLDLVAALNQSHARVHGIGPNLLREFNW